LDQEEDLKYSVAINAMRVILTPKSLIFWLCLQTQSQWEKHLPKSRYAL